jgi:hypothetical protein
MANAQTGGPLLVGSPRLVIQYIRGYRPYLEASASTTHGRANTSHTQPADMQLKKLIQLPLRGIRSEMNYVSTAPASDKWVSIWGYRKGILSFHMYSTHEVSPEQAYEAPNHEHLRGGGGAGIAGIWWRWVNPP